jgi:hypothetical protein
VWKERSVVAEVVLEVMEVAQGRKLNMDRVLIGGLKLGVCVIMCCWFGMLSFPWRR